MCSEFLRQPEAATVGLPVMETLLLLGSTLRDLDIYGITSDGRKIAARVTFSKFDSIAWKIEKLKRYRDLPNVVSLMFCEVEKELRKNSNLIFLGTRHFSESSLETPFRKRLLLLPTREVQYDCHPLSRWY